MLTSISIQLTNFFDRTPSVMVLDANRIIGFRQNSDKTTSILLEGGRVVETTVWESELQWILHELAEAKPEPGYVFRYDGRDEATQAAIRAFRVNVLGWPEQGQQQSPRAKADAFGTRAAKRRETGAADTDRVGPGVECPECGDNVHEDEFIRDGKDVEGNHFRGCRNCLDRVNDDLLAAQVG